MSERTGSCVVCEADIRDLEAAVVVAGRPVCAACAVEIARRVAEAESEPVEAPAAPFSDAPLLLPTPPESAPEPAVPAASPGPEKPPCPRCQRPLSRGRRRALRFGTVAPLLLGLLLGIAAVVPDEDLLDFGAIVTGRDWAKFTGEHGDAANEIREDLNVSVNLMASATASSR